MANQGGNLSEFYLNIELAAKKNLFYNEKKTNESFGA